MLKITEDKDAIFHLHFSSFSFIILRKFVTQNIPHFLGFPKLANLYQRSKKCRSYDAICKILPSENEQTLSFYEVKYIKANNSRQSQESLNQISASIFL